jgi:exodeoxyribonuclease VIII
MIDLETLGTEPDAAILSIGAVKFDPMKPGDDIDSFYVTINPASCIAYKMSVSGGTLLWWFDADRVTARKELLAQPMVDLWDALDGFATWFGPESLPVWGNGASFDNVLLRGAFARVGIMCPWKFTHDRCYRTIKNLAVHVDMKREGTHHNALDDAVSQARHLQAIVESLELVV